MNDIKPTPPVPPPTPPSTKGYGKRPIWQWIAIYVVIGGLVYWGIYYFAYAKKGGYSANTNTSGYSY